MTQGEEKAGAPDRAGTRRWVRFVRLAVCLVVLAAIWGLVLYGPGAMPDPFFRKTVRAGAGGPDGAWEETFTIAEPVPCLHVRVSVKGAPTPLRLDLDGEGDIWLLRDLRMSPGHASFSCGRNLPAGTYTLRVHETGATGEYSIEIGSRAGVTWWQRLLVACVGVLAFTGGLSLVYLLRTRAGRSSRALAAAPYAFLAVVIAVSSIFLYLLFHEGGHALAAICFGDFDWSRSDFFGFGGSPHSGVKPGVKLASWQRAVQSVAGPMLPLIVAYLLFIGWRSAWGKRVRGERWAVDVLWSFVLFIFLFSGFGPLLPVFGVAPDGDYNGFVQNIPFARWQANAFFIAIAIVNVCLLVPIIAHFERRRRAWFQDLAAKAQQNAGVQGEHDA